MNAAATLATPSARPGPAARRVVTAAVDARSYANLLFLILAFPLGLVYFTFLCVGFALGLGLAIVWVGLPILVLVLLASRGLVLLERGLATYLLRAELPPVGRGEPLPGEPGLWRRFVAFLKNPVTWTGLAYLALKFPFGVVTFCVEVTLVALSLGLLATPLLYQEFDVNFGPYWIDSLPRALAMAAAGLLLALLTIHVCNGLAWLWRRLAVGLLGSRKFSTRPPVEQQAAA